jgi:hypothetical protein
LGELGEAVLFDLTLRVQAQRPLDLDLHVKTLAIEPILVALVVAAKGLVALEDVLERAAPRVMDAHRIVGRDRAVDEAPLGPVGVPLPEPLEDSLALPPLEDPALERGVIGYRSQRFEDLSAHVFDFTEAREHVGHPDR